MGRLHRCSLRLDGVFAWVHCCKLDHIVLSVRWYHVAVARVPQSLGKGHQVTPLELVHMMGLGQRGHFRQFDIPRQVLPWIRYFGEST